VSTRVRAFFALPLPEAAKPVMTGAIQRMQEAARGSRLGPRWQPAHKLHVTLKFLGWVEPERLPELWTMGVACARGLPAIRAELGAANAFGRTRRARVVVAGVTDPGASLIRLADELEAGAAALGFEPEERAFRPHVTLARLKMPGNVAAWLEAAAIEPLPVLFDELCLYRSDLSSEGGVYTVLERLPLPPDRQASPKG
jgi:RNA 2',3'-cyclic 3'-phosphodiesterase